MTWTTNKPTVPGWWWWRSQNKGIVIVQQLFACDFERMNMFGVSGEWAGPIEPPKEAP